MKNLPRQLLSLAAMTAGTASAADRFWDGGTVNLTTNGNGLSTYTSGTWNTSLTNWDAGASPRVAWNNANLDNAIFAGTYVTGLRTVTIGSNITVGQIRINTGSTGANRYDIGASSTQNDFAITFGGTYSDSFAAIEGPAATSATTPRGFLNNNFNAKITGTIDGGLVVRHGSNSLAPGRLSFTNPNSDFIGDMVMMSGNLSVGTQMGAAENKLVLKGGSLFAATGAAGTAVFARDIDVASASGFFASASVSGLQAVELTGPITGSGGMVLNSVATDTAVSEVRLQGSMSGYSGLFENRGTAATFLMIQTTATSSGSWMLTSGTMKLDTASDDAIADGPGKTDLFMSGGTLDLNGNPETINGLSGTTGFVVNSLAATEAVLTLGAADATASFGGAIQNGTGTVALVKTGSGSQTLGGNNTFTGATTVAGGKLIIGGSLADSAVRVQSGAGLTVSGLGKSLQALALDAGSTLTATLVPPGGVSLGVDDVLAFNGGTVTIVPAFTEVPSLGTYDFVQPLGGVTGSATLAVDFSALGINRLAGTAQIDGGILKVTITDVGAYLIWNNATATGEWNLAGATNFLNGGSGDVFKQYDNVTFGPSSPAGTVLLTGSLVPQSVTVDSASDFTFEGSGSIGGATGLTKSGSGTLTVNNFNTITGPTTVTGGTLAVNGTLDVSDVTVQSSGTLAGSGSASGDVIVAGVLSPGNGIGTITTGDLTLSGTFACEVDGDFADKVAVFGNLNLSNAVLSLSELSAPTKANYVIATYTGTLTGSFSTLPSGYIIDTSVPGQILLWQQPPAPLPGTITFESNQGYTLNTDIAPANGAATNAPYNGTNGWSRSTSNGPVRSVASPSSGEYLGGTALSTGENVTYIGGVKSGVIQYTGTNTITYDAQYGAAIAVGFMKDADADGLFDQTGSPTGDTGMSFGAGGSPLNFGLRLTNFGATVSSPLGGNAFDWYRISVTIGEVVAGNRTITMGVRNLTTSTDLDFDTVAEGVQPFIQTVADATFGVAPELADGIFVRVTRGGDVWSKIDNIRVTSVSPSAYDAWMAGFPSITGSNRGGEEDPDRDGIKNLLEFVLDGKPNLSDPSILPSGSVTGGNLFLTFKRRDDSEGLVSQVVQHSTTLGSWDDIVIGAESGAGYTVEELGAAPDLITVSIPTGTDPKKFARLVATQLAP